MKQQEENTSQDLRTDGRTAQSIRRSLIDPQGLKRGISIGLGIVLTLATSPLIAVSVTGTINSFTSGGVVDAAQINTNFTSLKTAVEGITSSQWTTNGSNITYTAGSVGIGTTNLPIFGGLTSPLTIFGGSGVTLKPASGGYNYLNFVTANDSNLAWGINDGPSREFKVNRYNSSGNFVDTPFIITNSTGAVAISGALSKGSGTFDIAHPDPSMPKNARLRHSFVESPTAGDNIYRWQVRINKENGKSFIRLPKYWTHLNTNPMVWVSGAEQPAVSFGYVDIAKEKVIVQADRVGTYNVLLLGTRKDSLAANNWKELGMEYISKGIGEAEKILSYNAQPEFGEEPQEQTSLRLAGIERSRNVALQENARLKEEMSSLRTDVKALKSLEERLSAMEKSQMQMAAAQAAQARK